MLRVAVTAGLLAWVALPALPAGAGGGGTDFSLRGYANNVRVVPPLVGEFQLGKAHIRGSGTLAPGSGMSGTIRVDTEPKHSRYEPASLRAKVVGYRYSATAHGVTKRAELVIEVLSARNGGPDCVAGVRGSLELVDSALKLDNGHRRDRIIMGDWAGDRCPTFVMGWTNNDGGRRTSPRHGGPPDGGQWAVVRIG